MEGYGQFFTLISILIIRLLPNSIQQIYILSYRLSKGFLMFTQLVVET